ncbi:MAG TPA: carboxypeptidase regulatory-like domain-containing protein, partial [Candidatus Baltobacteraceae bacterium]|nr:carboxypeptidase regulatory-like domain-containing protein [Candidatus Baltobacteraceae bacterium]
MNKWLSLRRCILVATMCAAFVSQETWALAGTTGGISGYVRDTDGNPVVNARVTMSSPSEVTSTSTDASGHFAFLSLAPDTYSLGAIKDGYQESSLAGVTVFADQVQTVAVTMPHLLRTIASVRSQSASNLVKSGVGGNIYNVDAGQIQKTSVLGGGGNLDSAYSAIASVPGLVVGTGGSGWNQAVIVHGNYPWYTGFEYDGIPVNRSFDNYTASTASNLGLQELQVYTGGGPSGISSAGVSGFINQVIKTGTYPGYGLLSGALGAQAFYHSARAEAGGASPNRNFSYYAGLSGYNQAFRYIDQSNGAALMAPGQPYADYGYLRSTPSGFGIESICDPLTGESPNTLAPFCLQPFSGLYGGTSSIADREAVANFHFGVPRHDGQRDDVQLLLSASALDTHVYSSLNDSGISALTAAATGVPYCGPSMTGPGCAAAGGPNYLTYADAIVYNLPFGTNIAPNNTALSPQIYLQPHSPTNRTAFAPLPFDLQDAMHNDTGVVKLQWTHPFNSRSFARVYGYTFYSDWT